MDSGLRALVRGLSWRARAAVIEGDYQSSVSKHCQLNGRIIVGQMSWSGHGPIASIRRSALVNEVRVTASEQSKEISVPSLKPHNTLLN